MTSKFENWSMYGNEISSKAQTGNEISQIAMKFHCNCNEISLQCSMYSQQYLIVNYLKFNGMVAMVCW